MVKYDGWSITKTALAQASKHCYFPLISLQENGEKLINLEIKKRQLMHFTQRNVNYFHLRSINLTMTYKVFMF